MANVLGPSQIFSNNEGELFVCDVSGSTGYGLWNKFTCIFWVGFAIARINFLYRCRINRPHF